MCQKRISILFRHKFWWNQVVKNCFCLFPFFNYFLFVPQLPFGVSYFLPEAANQLQPADQSQQPVQHSTGDRGDQSNQDAGLWERSEALPSDGASQRGAWQPQHGHGGWFNLTLTLTLPINPNLVTWFLHMMVLFVVQCEKCVSYCLVWMYNNLITVA